MSFLDLFEPVYGRRCWNVGAVSGSFLSIEFGDKYSWARDPRVAAPPGTGMGAPEVNSVIYSLHGDWHLLLFRCDWRVISATTVIGDSATSRAIARAASRLEGGILKRVVVNPDGSTRFQFDRYARLETKPHDARAEQWFLVKTSGCQVLTCYGDGRLDLDQNENCFEDEDRRILDLSAATVSSSP